jgi:hypothetical protein
MSIIARSEIRMAIDFPATTAIAAQIVCPKIAPIVTSTGLFAAANAIVANCVRWRSLLEVIAPFCDEN